MKLVNYSLWRLGAIFVVMLSLATMVFFFIQKYAIRESVDDALEDAAEEIIFNITRSEDLLIENSVYSSVFVIQSATTLVRERYKDTVIFYASENEMEKVRMFETGFSHKGQYYRLQLFFENIESIDILEIVLRWLAVVVGSLLVVLFLFSLSANRIWKPFYSLLHQLRNFKLNFIEKVEMPATSILEFNQLNESVQTLLQQNIEVYEEQKQFIENASHELQTPLAVSIGKLELLLEDTTLNKEQAQKIDSVLVSLSRMKRLNTTLLFISKIKNKQYPVIDNVCLNTIVDEILQTYHDLIVHKSITVNRLEDKPCCVQINSDLAFMLVSNLMKNAIIHNVKNGTINISMNERQLEISNSGKQEAIAEEKIFTRYRHSSDNKFSTGLGLSIVKTIVDFYNFRIDYSYKNELHYFKLKI